MLAELPVEIVEFVCNQSCLSYVDITHLEECCSRLQKICNSNEIWKKKFKDRWSDLWNDVVQLDNVHWKELFQRRLMCRRVVRREIDAMSVSYYKKDELNNEAFDVIKSQMDDYCLGYQFVLDELLDILDDSNGHNLLTLKYYAKKALTFVRHSYLHKRWGAFFKLPEKDQSLEEGMIMAAQWFQPTDLIDPKKISDLLDGIAKRVLDLMKCRHPESDKSPLRTRTVLTLVSEVLFREMGFTNDMESYYEPEKSFIDKVLDRKTGNPITLCVMYLLIAKRLGVLCEPVGFPAHFLLRWEEYPHLPFKERYTFIDVFNGGKFLRYDELRGLLTRHDDHIHPSMTTAISPSKVFFRVARNLINAGHRLGNVGLGMRYLRYGLELLLIISPEDIDSRLLLLRMYLHFNINLTEVLCSLQEIQHQDPAQSGIVAYMYQLCHSLMKGSSTLESEEMEIQMRGTDTKVSFAVGMIMRHKTYGYCCVIHGWDPVCTASREWKVQMGVDRLPLKDLQPFYNVLVSDGSMRYAAQENLEIHPEPQYINHPEIGRYFKEFKINHYVPNDENAKEYPNDEALRTCLLEEAYGCQALS